MQTVYNAGRFHRAATLILLCFVAAGLLAGTCFKVQAQVGVPYAWGDNHYGQLGNGSTTGQFSAKTLSGIANVVSLACGAYHTLAIKSDETLWAWGYNEYGQLGDGTNTNRITPTRIIGVSKVVQFAAGGYNSLALKSDGTVWAWGVNGWDDLGRPTTFTTVPAQVAGLGNIVQIATSGYHTLALKSDGTVWAWGSNGTGQLGDGTTDHRNTPIQVTGLTGATQISAGQVHSLALKSDGTVWAWGNNDRGQLGDGSDVGRTTPVQVSGLTGVTQVVGGSEHTLALKSDGTVWAWGSNRTGQLGNGNKNEFEVVLTPAPVPNLSKVSFIAAVRFQSFALQSGGSVWGWGTNNSGQLGQGTSDTQYLPAQAIGLAQQTFLAAGGGHTLSTQAVVRVATLTASNITAQYGSVTLSATLKLNGMPLSNRRVAFSLDSISVGTIRTNATGKAILKVSKPLRIGLGTYTISAVSSGDLLYTSNTATATLTVVKADTTVKVYSVSGAPGVTKSLKAVLKRNTDSALLASKSLAFSIDGNQIGTANTDGTGTALLFYNFEETYSIGSHTLSVAFAGDSNHNASTGSSTLKVAQASAKIVPSSISGKVGSVVSLKAKLTRKTDGAVLAGRTVRFKVDNDTVLNTEVGSATTDGTGTAIFNYTIPDTLSQGKHTITALFDGDAFYLSVSGAGVYLTVK